MTVSLLHSVPADGSFSAAGAAAWDAQHVFTQATDRLLGRTTAGVGATEEISVGAGLTLSGGTLVNAGATSPIGGSDTQVQFNDGGVFAGNANFTFNKATNQIAIAAGTAAAPTLIPSGDTNTGVWFPAADTIAASTGGTERFRILSSGSVSIGTTSDFNLLGVSSTTSGTRISVNTFTVTTGDFTGIDFGVTTGTGTSKKGGILFERTGAGGVGTIHLATNNVASAANVALADSRLAILSSGNVGIGTTAPGARLQVNSEIRVADGTTTLRSITSGGVSFFGNITDHPIVVQTNNAERIRILNTGNVGIGTSSPTTLLSVNGVASFGAGTAALPSVAAFGDLDTGMWFPAANTIAWSTNGTERMRINSSGNIGLGTSTFGTSAATAFAIATGTAPTTGPADTIQIYSTDLSAGNTMLSLYTEGTVVNANTTAATTHRIALRVNGTVYYLLANTAA